MTSMVLRCGAETNALQDETGENSGAEKRAPSNRKKYTIHPYEVSVRYLKSNAYKRTYGDKPVWVPYRRNFKGTFPPRTRRKCVVSVSIKRSCAKSIPRNSSTLTAKFTDGEIPYFFQLKGMPVYFSIPSKGARSLESALQLEKIRYMDKISLMHASFDH